MKRYFAKAVGLSIITIFLAIGVTFAQDNLSTAIFKIETKSKEAKVKIETIVNMLKGVSEAEMDLNSKRLEVKYDSTQIQEDMILFAIQTMGYPSSIEREDVQKSSRTEKSQSVKDSTKR